MNLKSWFKELLRWLIAVGVAAILYFVVLFAGLVMTIGRGARVGDAVMTFLPPTIGILSGCLIAPRRGRGIALFVFSALTLLALM